MIQTIKASKMEKFYLREIPSNPFEQIIAIAT